MRKLALFLAFACLAGMAASFSYPVNGSRNAIVHLFEWKWDQIALECEDYLGPAGFWGVQVSPPQDHIWDIYSNGFHNPWWVRYQPVDYIINSRSGDEAAFSDMCKRCKAAGVNILVDVVLNHMAGGQSSAVSYAKKSYSGWVFPEYGYNDFHHDLSDCIIADADYNGNNDRVRKCRLSGMPDLKTEDDTFVRPHLAAFLNKLIDLGAAGFRVDAAKHMYPADLINIVGRTKNAQAVEGSRRPFVYQEVINDPAGIHPSEYYGAGSVINLKYGSLVGDKYNEGAPSKLVAYHLDESWDLTSSGLTVQCIDNHDNQRSSAGSQASLTYKSGRNYNLATLFMLAWPYGFPRIMSSFKFDAHDQGPPTCGSDLACDRDDGRWVKEHRLPGVKGLVQFRGYTLGLSAQNKWTGSDKQFAFSLGNKGFFAQNADTNNKLDAWIQTGMPAGTYCDVAHGSELSSDGKSCSGNSIAVMGDGKAHIEINANDTPGSVAIHYAAKTN